MRTQVTDSTDRQANAVALRVGSQSQTVGQVFNSVMAATPDNVIPFPLNRRATVRACPHCGAQSDVWPIGRILWGFCITHEVRWVVADYKNVIPETIDRHQLRKGLEFLSLFAEISR